MDEPSENQLTGFYAMGTFIVNELTRSPICSMFCMNNFFFNSRNLIKIQVTNVSSCLLAWENN